MSITGRVVLAVTFQKVHHSPDTEARTQGNHKGLQNVNCAVEKFHKSYPPKNVFELFRYINLVHIEAVRGLYHGALLLHVPFHVKDIFRVGVGGVPVIRMLRQVVLLR